MLEVDRGFLIYIFLTTEFSIVASMALSTEILPQARATMMALNLAASGIGRVCGIFFGSHIWSSGGIKAIGLVSALCCVLAFVSLWIGLRDFKEHAPYAAAD